ncbi:MAG: hypothetical protein IPM57_00630 [Oligoflexia bacterium]|nr:hypothetical protein [Oligoflexia bacterium]
MTSFISFWPLFLCISGIVEFSLQIFFKIHRFLGVSFYLCLTLLFYTFFKKRSAVRTYLKQLKKEFFEAGFLFQLLFLILTLLFGLSIWESLLPPHLPQEFDVINYHMAFTKQHYIQNIFRPIWWAAADLRPLIIQWGFSPTWFMGKTVNKLPQIISCIWLFFILLEIGRMQFKNFYGWLPAIIFMTTHGVVIQLGTGMLDLTGIYFLTAAFYCFIKDKNFFGSVHLSFYCTSKSFYIFQVIGVLVSVLLFLFIFKRAHFYKIIHQVKKPFVGTCLVTFILILPSAYWSMQRAGTPIFPFGTCQIYKSASGCQGKDGEIIKASSKETLEVRNQYSPARDPMSFIKHLWKVAVPSNGVNNEYDYPLGLGWLLWLVFLGFSINEWIRKKQIPIFALIALGFWASWWMGSHQSRWLYPVLVFGWLAVLPVLPLASKKLLLGVLIVGAGISLISQWRAFRATLFMSPAQIEANQKTQLKWDPQTGLLQSLESLYVDEPLTDHAPGARSWILK